MSREDKRMPVSKPTIALALFIFAMAFFARKISTFIKAAIGSKGFMLIVCFMFVIIGVVLLSVIVRGYAGTAHSFALGALLVMTAVFTWQMKLPEEKVHFLEYGLLGWLAGRDLLKGRRNMTNAFLAFVFSAGIGALDEGLQYFIPGRFCDIRDVAVNIWASFLGVFVYFLPPNSKIKNKKAS
jgi:hypothetical protein